MCPLDYQIARLLKWRVPQWWFPTSASDSNLNSSQEAILLSHCASEANDVHVCCHENQTTPATDGLVVQRGYISIEICWGSASCLRRVLTFVKLHRHFYNEKTQTTYPIMHLCNSYYTSYSAIFMKQRWSMFLACPCDCFRFILRRVRHRNSTIFTCRNAAILKWNERSSSGLVLVSNRSCSAFGDMRRRNETKTKTGTEILIECPAERECEILLPREKFCSRRLKIAKSMQTSIEPIYFRSNGC